MNPQHGVVGNLGDVIKHAALVAVAGWLREHVNGADVNYLETHAFQVEAPFGRGGRAEWDETVARKSGQWPAYKAYTDLERKRGDGRYLCSVGIALQQFAARRLYLAERDPDTRATLIAQLRAGDHEPYLVLGDLVDFALLKGASLGPLLGLVDPTSFEAVIWDSVRHAIALLHDPSRPGVVLVFDFGQDSKQHWPPPAPTEAWRLAAKVREDRFHLACYATESHAAEVARVLGDLGWSRVSAAATTCDVCGREVPPEYRFCHHCGASLQGTGQPALSAPPPGGMLTGAGDEAEFRVKVRGESWWTIPAPPRPGSAAGTLCLACGLPAYDGEQPKMGERRNGNPHRDHCPPMNPSQPASRDARRIAGLIRKRGWFVDQPNFPM